MKQYLQSIDFEETYITKDDRLDRLNQFKQYFHEDLIGYERELFSGDNSQYVKDRIMELTELILVCENRINEFQNTMKE